MVRNNGRDRGQMGRWRELRIWRGSLRQGPKPGCLPRRRPGRGGWRAVNAQQLLTRLDTRLLTRTLGKYPIGSGIEHVLLGLRHLSFGREKRGRCVEG